MPRLNPDGSDAPPPPTPAMKGKASVSSQSKKELSVNRSQQQRGGRLIAGGICGITTGEQVGGRV